jgi:hypothetical protein
MKTQAIMSNILYGGVKVEKNVTPELKSAILASPAVKRLGMFYKSEITSSFFQKQNSADKKVEAGLLIHKVKPRNILVRIFDFFAGRETNRGFFYNSKKETQSGLISSLAEMKKDTFVKMLARHE